jgi:hypothetical protein
MRGVDLGVLSRFPKSNNGDRGTDNVSASESILFILNYLTIVTLTFVGDVQGTDGDYCTDSDTNGSPCARPGWTTDKLQYIMYGINWNHRGTPSKKDL